MPSLAELRRQLIEKQEVIPPPTSIKSPRRTTTKIEKQDIDIEDVFRKIIREEFKTFAEIDINKILLKLKSMDEETNPLYSVIIRRAKSGRKSYVESIINFTNEYIDDLIKEG